MNVRDAIGFRLRDARKSPVWYRGSRVECPLCHGHFRRFKSHRGRRHARCPRCGAAERHRLLALFLERETDLLRAPHRVLHFAPEPPVAALLSPRANLEYVSGDLTPGAAMEVMDITSIPRQDASFDVVICNHVLEHVPDDRQAMRELFRVLEPGGTAYLQHPIDPDRASTDEDPSIDDPAEQLRRFGQQDHVRIYGRDHVTRLAEAGFQVKRRPYDDEVPQADRRRYGLATDPGVRRSGDIYVCRRPAAQT